jgi:hypothetical protein
VDLREVRIHEGDAAEATFITRDGHHAYNVMPSGLPNALVTFFIGSNSRYIPQEAALHIEDFLWIRFQLQGLSILPNHWGLTPCLCPFQTHAM